VQGQHGPTHQVALNEIVNAQRAPPPPPPPSSTLLYSDEIIQIIYPTPFLLAQLEIFHLHFFFWAEETGGSVEREGVRSEGRGEGGDRFGST